MLSVCALPVCAEEAGQDHPFLGIKIRVVQNHVRFHVGFCLAVLSGWIFQQCIPKYVLNRERLQGVANLMAPVFVFRLSLTCAVPYASIQRGDSHKFLCFVVYGK